MRRLRASLSFALLACATALPFAAQAAVNKGTAPVGGHYDECHGYVLHLSAANLRVHCIDGRPADLSFVSFPRFAIRRDHGRTVQDVRLKPGTPVHVIYTHELGLRHAYKVYVANPRGHGLFGFKT
jgi:hypothetical protein